MMKETDLKAVKDMAKLFLGLDPVKTPFSPGIIQHPFFDSAIMPIRDKNTDKQNVVNILENEEGFKQLKELKRQQIEEAQDIVGLASLITKPYRLIFLKHIQIILSRQDIGRYLTSIWGNIEYISMNKDVTKARIVHFFKDAYKSTLMNEEELKALRELPDRIKIYRGVTDYNKKHAKSLSWTLKKQIARYYANRFGSGGYVYEASIEKAYVLAYFIFRTESELIVEYKKLQNLHMIEILKPDGSIEAVE